MPKKEKRIKNVAMVIRPRSGSDAAEAELVREFLEQNGMSVLLAKTDSEELKGRLNEREFDLLIALGGDGTMLRAGHLTAPLGIPVLGINLGRFGFLMQLSKSDWKECLPRLVERGVQDREPHDASGGPLARRTITGQLPGDQRSSGMPRAGGTPHPHSRTGGRAQPGFVRGRRADRCHPTGSTAYALAVNGPIMPPGAAQHPYCAGGAAPIDEPGGDPA